MVIPVFIGADNVETFQVLYGGTPYDLDVAGVTSVTAYVCGKLSELGTVKEVEALFSGSNISVQFGGLRIPTGKYTAKIKAISPTYPNGIVVGTVSLNVRC